MAERRRSTACETASFWELLPLRLGEPEIAGDRPGRDQWVRWSKVRDKHSSLQQQLTFSTGIYMHKLELNLL